MVSITARTGAEETHLWVCTQGPGWPPYGPHIHPDPLCCTLNPLLFTPEQQWLPEPDLGQQIPLAMVLRSVFSGQSTSPTPRAQGLT